MSRTVHIRVIRPYRNNTFVGHYDLMIAGNVTFRGRSFSNPVFSYRNVNPAEIHVVYGNESLNIYGGYINPDPITVRGNYGYSRTKIYRWTKVVSDSDFNEFLAYINSWIDGDDVISYTTTGIKCYLYDDNPFYEYSEEEHNCYYAVELWCYAMGINDMRALHLAPSSYQYMYYAAGNMVDAYSHASWVKIVDV